MPVAAGLRGLRALTLTLCLTVGGARAGQPEQAPAPPLPGDPLSTAHAPVPTLPADPADRLDNAVRAYHAGQQDLALSLLTALIRDADPRSEVLREARVYMAEILLFQGNEASAREALELVLREQPGLVLDPFRHPPDICAFFELVKASGTWRAAPVEDPGPAPATRRPSPWLPLGIAQARQQRPTAAALLATGQGLSCGLSAALFLWITADRRYGSEGQPGFTEDGDRLWPLSTLQARRTAQWSATAACYASYGLGVVDASAAQRRARRQAALSLRMTPSAPGLLLTAPF